MTTVFVRHPELRLTSVEDEGVVLHLGSLRYFTVNETGRTILEALEQPRTLDELVKAITDEFDVTDALAESTAREFLDHCQSAKLLHTEER